MSTEVNRALIHALEPEQMTEEARQYLERYREKVSPDDTFVRVMAHAPQFLRPVAKLGQTLRGEAGLGPRLVELVRLKIARLNQCAY